MARLRLTYGSLSRIGLVCVVEKRPFEAEVALKAGPSVTSTTHAHNGDNADRTIGMPALEDESIYHVIICDRVMTMTFRQAQFLARGLRIKAKTSTNPSRT